MKIRIILLLTVALFSCDSNESEPLTLKGRWIWTSTCGSFFGCLYPSPNNSRFMIITGSVITIERNGVVTNEIPYQVNNISFRDGDKIYEVELSDNDGTNITFTVSLSSMKMEYGTPTVLEYTRL